MHERRLHGLAGADAGLLLLLLAYGLAYGSAA